VTFPLTLLGCADEVIEWRSIVRSYRRRDQAVRALVLREDQRTDALRANGVDVDVGDLTQARDVAGALSDCRRRHFGMSVSPSDVEATVTTAQWPASALILRWSHLSNDAYPDDGLSSSGSSGNLARQASR
jgi:uncharacterized protein YbjT (DUF2867 family)